MTTTRLVLIMIAVLLCPTQAHAARGFWGWLEELSGPGPFKGGAYAQPVACVDKNGRLTACWRTKIDDNTPRIPQTLVVSAGVFNSGDRPRFDDLPAADADNRGNVRLLAVSGLYVLRVHRSLDLGAGAGFVRLSGARFDPFYKLVLTPFNGSFAPLALASSHRYARILRFEYDKSFVPQGFKGADFDNLRTGFDSGPEFITRYGIVIDFGALFWP
jgi:hypothetical protein